MVKKLLFISFLCIVTAGFSQKTLTQLSAAPNPFITRTSIQFETTKNQPVFLIIKNELGKTVFKKTHSSKKGKNSIPFYKNNLKSGMYFYIIQSNKEVISKRFIIQ